MNWPDHDSKTLADARERGALDEPTFQELRDRVTVIERGAWCQTYIGGQFFLDDPKPEEINILDIARALSQSCRYRGHTLRFYSVAEHSVLLAVYTSAVLGRSLRDTLKALLHDAGEAYYGDIPSPWKDRYPVLRELAKPVDDCIATKFAVELGKPDWLHEIDERIRCDEKAALMVPRDDWKLHDDGPLGVSIQAWTPLEAEQKFLRLFNDLRTEIAKEPKREATFDPRCAICAPAGSKQHPGRCMVKGPRHHA